MKLLLTSLLLASTSLTTLAVGGQPMGHSGVHASAGSQTAGGVGQWRVTNSFADVNVQAKAEASLVGGALHAYAWSSNNPTLPKGCRPDMLWCNWGTSADAWFYDKITLQADDSYDPGDAISWSWSVEGETTRGKWWSGSSATSRFYVGTNPEGWRTAITLDAKNSSREISSSFLIPAQGQAMMVYIYGSLSVFAEGGAVADYSHTARFNWELPEGVTAMSASGKFMTAPVPEPSSYALMLAGLAVLPWARRRLGARG
jgi:PEP-CTERM motif